MKNIILKVEHLKTEFKVGRKIVHAVNDVNLTVERGRTICIVGESGCGKSVTADSILRLLPKNGYIVDGEIKYYPTSGSNEIFLSEFKGKSKGLRNIRGKDIAMVFQNPMTSLNPVYTVGFQVMENLRNHEKISKSDARVRIVKMFKELGIPAPEKRYDEYPHQFSGGMKQRVMIAIAMICNPNILIADEPTTALDVTIQAQILRLMKKLQDKYGTTIIMITHNMGIVAEIADFVSVMYMGRVVEAGSVKQIFNNPKHPYTQALMCSVPQLNMSRDTELASIPGNTPDASEQFDYCEFQQRCRFACDRCKAGFPEEIEVEQGHTVRCFLYSGGEYNV